MYQERARRVLRPVEHQPWVRWLFEPLRPTILAELGRIEDDRLLVELAQWVCEEQPYTHDALVLLREERRWRQGPLWRRRGGWKPREAVLADRILAEMNRYLLVHPSMSPTEIRKALTIVRKTLAVDQAMKKSIGR